jgi:hypothetical protein
MEVVMEAAAAAKNFHDCAATEGLMPDGPVKPVSSTPDEFAHIEPLADAAKQILRRRAVLGIIFDQVNGAVVVLTKLAKPTKKQLTLLPNHIDDVSISYRQGSPTPIGGEPPRPFGNPPFVVRQVGGLDRYACGSSVSQGNSRDAGTMGCLVRDADGALYGLSNNHVTGGCSHAGVGLPILAPGVLDVMPASEDPFTIGYHERALDMMVGTPDNTNPANNLDAAIFKIADDAQVTSYQGLAYDTPTTTGAVVAGTTVEKVGRTTGHTQGTVVGQYYGGLSILYDMEIHHFRGRVFFEPVFVVKGKSGTFADSGDSGALVTMTDGPGQRDAIGIVVGGMVDRDAPGGVLTFILPITSILQKLGVALVSGHNV